MEEALKQYGGLLIAAAVIIILIAVIVKFGSTNFLGDKLEALVETFTTSAQEAAGF